MLLGYNTNGFAHHDPFAAVEILAELGYQSVAITLDHGVLNPFDPRVADQTLRMRDHLQRHGLRSVVETGARYLLDARHKHEPTLLSAEPSARQRRFELLCLAIEIAVRLGSDCVSMWSGVLRDPASPDAAWKRLSESLRQVLDFAGEREMIVGFEPEPGMWIATLNDYQRLLSHVDAANLRLTLDVGHLHCLGEVPIVAEIHRWHTRLVNVHLEDMRFGVHEHLMFGEGEMDFPPILAALGEIGYRGGLHVELSRHSHLAPDAARQAFHFLQPLIAILE